MAQKIYPSTNYLPTKSNVNFTFSQLPFFPAECILIGIFTHAKLICISRKYIINLFNSIDFIFYYVVGQNPLVKICEIQSIMGNNSSTFCGELGCLHDVNATADLRQSSIRFHFRRGMYKGPSANFASDIRRI